jgi:hypothetical protein
MAAKKTLTRTEGYALTDSKKAARLSVDWLATRTALYAWDDKGECWVRDQDGLKIVHCKGTAGMGFIWSTKLRQFTRCACTKCAL